VGGSMFLTVASWAQLVNRTAASVTEITRFMFDRLSFQDSHQRCAAGWDLQLEVNTARAPAPKTVFHSSKRRLNEKSNNRSADRRPYAQALSSPKS
jgi:hypothetical protein